MPFKLHQSHRRTRRKKTTTNKRNWSQYNKRLTMRGDIAIWLSPDVINQWYQQDRKYVGDGAPTLYSDMVILTVHEIRQVFRLPLRQCEGFVNALFTLMKLDLRCPSFSTLSKRLKQLTLSRPFYRLTHAKAEDIKAIAIDSTGLKCYGHDEWALEKHGNTRQKREWRKLHIVVDEHHIIQSSELASRRTQDMDVVDDLIDPMHDDVQHVTADAAYDANKIYASLLNKFKRANVVIPPKKGSTYHKKRLSDDVHYLSRRPSKILSDH